MTSKILSTRRRLGKSLGKYLNCFQNLRSLFDVCVKVNEQCGIVQNLLNAKWSSCEDIELQSLVLSIFFTDKKKPNGALSSQLGREVNNESQRRYHIEK